jgi:uncharacterized protein (TIGR02147 family)
MQMPDFAENTGNKRESGMSKLSVLGYTNYRTFLGDFYKARKASRSGFSFRQFSQQAGLSSPNFYKLVIEGQRNLTEQSIEQTIGALGLSGSSADYFRCLVQWNQSKTDNEKAEWLLKLEACMPAHRRHELQLETLEYLSHWLYPVMREMVLWDEFRDDPYWVQRRLPTHVDLKLINQALLFLKKSDFIVKDESGRFKLRDDIILSSDEVRSLAIRNYHRHVLDQAASMLEALPVDQREFGAIIINMPEASLGEMKAKLKAFRDELLAWSMAEAKKSQGNDAVIQFNFQMYPQAKRAVK